VISLLAQVLRGAAQETAGPDGFVGHIGGDDFVVLIPPEAAEAFARQVIAGFDGRVPTLYDPEDAASGYVELNTRDGMRRFPIVSISIGITFAFIDGPDSINQRDLVELANSLMRLAKRESSSSYALKRKKFRPAR
jgi:GGDEF domain-containing protein